MEEQLYTISIIMHGCKELWDKELGVSPPTKDHTKVEVQGRKGKKDGMYNRM
jgi:hypothetical protein